MNRTDTRIVTLRYAVAELLPLVEHANAAGEYWMGRDVNPAPRYPALVICGQRGAHIVSNGVGGVAKPPAAPLCPPRDIEGLWDVTLPTEFFSEGFSLQNNRDGVIAFEVRLFGDNSRAHVEGVRMYVKEAAMTIDLSKPLRHTKTHQPAFVNKYEDTWVITYRGIGTCDWTAVTAGEIPEWIENVPERIALDVTLHLDKAGNVVRVDNSITGQTIGGFTTGVAAKRIQCDYEVGEGL